MRKIARLAAASAVGTALEWYDFTIYNVMAALVFNRVFFPSFDPLAGTLLAFSTYAVGYFARPMGGVVFGRLGDQRGRRFVLVATLILMGIATALIGLLPSYQHWGVWSSVLLVFLRFVQGAAIGGEWAGAVLLSLEHGAAHQRGRNGSFAQMGPASGTLLGTGVIALVGILVTPAAFESWGWRVPFGLSAVLVIFGLWLRYGVEETPAFMQLKSAGLSSDTPIQEVFRLHKRPLFTCIGVRVGPDVMYALLAVFTLTYVTTVMHLPRSIGLSAAMAGAVCHAISIPFFGSLTDRLGRRPVYAIGSVLSVIWAFVYFVLMDSRRPILIGLAVAAGLAIHGSMYGPQAAFIAEQFPARVRYAGASVSYTLAGVVAGALAPLLFALIYQAYGSTIPISLYVAAALGITTMTLWCARETARLPLAN